MSVDNEDKIPQLLPGLVQTSQFHISGLRRCNPLITNSHHMNLDPAIPLYVPLYVPRKEAGY
jgi:hypothetical protein